MGQATRTTKLLLDLGERRQGGAHTEKRAALDATEEVLNRARAFYIDFFLAHAEKLSERVPNMPLIYRRSVIKDAIGRVRSHLSHRARWEKSGQKKGKPGLPGARDHPTLYKGTCSLQLGSSDLHARFVQRKRLRWTGMALGELPSKVQPLLPAAPKRRGVGAQKPYPVAGSASS